MAGFSISQTEQIGAERSGGGGFFSLKNDRDVARVRQSKIGRASCRERV